MSISSESTPGACAAVGALSPPCRAARGASLKGALTPRTGALESDGLNLVVGRWIDGDGSEFVVVLNSGGNSCSVETKRASGEVIRTRMIFMGLRRPSEVLVYFCGRDYVLNADKVTEMELRWEPLRGSRWCTWKRLVTPGPLLLARRDLEKSQLNWRPKVPHSQLADKCEEHGLHFRLKTVLGGFGPEMTVNLVQSKKGKYSQTRRCRAPQVKGDPFIRLAAQLVLGRGELVVDEYSKFVGYFDLGLEDDDEFCLVKRVLGKGGHNMRSIAEECSAKLRLRGIGSGFLEGREAREASMPLQIHISCMDLDNYMKAIGQVGTLLKELYKHYRRYATSKGMTTPELKMRFEELRRDDHGLNQFESRSDSQKARDRLDRDQGRQHLSFLKKSEKTSLASEVTSSCARSETTCPEASFLDSPETLADASPREEEGTQGELELYSGRRIPVPTTAAGRRLVARFGGAKCASLADQAAREVQQRQRDERKKARAWSRPRPGQDKTVQTWVIGEAFATEGEKHRAQVQQRGWEAGWASRGGEKRSGGWGKMGEWDDEWGDWDEWGEWH
ncbi:unnamed protein product [Polarella glacialis]|uniref:KHDC4/BBP-like KH-domain type I domain-containing protein n=1 Tax=Polarella glacialis TaxID=89957 RepID=A0A813J1G1_POLGL|nr:unnamed protein product [Polarella glacialis]